MKQRYFLLVCLLAVLFACKKVDNELADQDAMPSVNTSELTLYEPGGVNGITANYPKEVVVGDTITLAGRLKIDQGATITLGNAPASLLFTAKRETRDYASGTVVSMDIVRFVVTPDMGGGPQPLVVRNGAFVRTAPDIIIRTVPVIASRTDTNLVVTPILSSVIAGFESRYQSVENISGPIFKGWSMSRDGEIWLQSPIDIYRIRNGQMESFLKAGDVLTVNGQPVTLAGFNGVAVNKENTTLFLSVDTKDGSSTTMGRYYLLKMDITTRQVTVLNSTWYRRRDAFSAQLIDVLPAQFINSGPAADIPVRAVSLKTDNKGRLLFVNDISVHLPATFIDVTSLSRISESGRLSTLLEGKANSDKLKFNRLFTVSDDGRYAWLAPSGDGLMQYDLELEEPVSKIDKATSLFNVSYEERAEYRFSTLLKPFNPGEGAAYCAMPGGDLLQAYGASIAAIELKAGALYAYAGLERGIGIGTSTPPPAQNNTEGQARYVDFRSIALLGTDDRNKVYLMRGGTKNGSAVIPPQLYLLGKP